MTETAAHHPPTGHPLRTIAAGAFALAVLAGVAVMLRPEVRASLGRPDLTS